MSIEVLNHKEIEQSAVDLATDIVSMKVSLKKLLKEKGLKEISIDKIDIERQVLVKAAEILKTEVYFGTSLNKHWFQVKDGNLIISVFER